MNPVYQSAFLKALGWSLIDSLWQMGLLWFIYIVLTNNGKKFSASSRHLLSVWLLSTGCILFIINIFFNYQHPGRSFSIFNYLESGLDYVPLLSISYLIVVGYLILHWFYQYLRSRNLQHNLLPADNEFTDFINRLRIIGGISRRIKIMLSDKIYTPVTTGFIKPIILLPVSIITRLNTAQIEALIVHEFYHIKRNDYLVHLLTSFAGAFFFFNPFARLLLNIIREEREKRCDDEVMALGYDRWEYSHALYTLSKNQHYQLPFALAATGTKNRLLLIRIQRLLRTTHSSPSILKPLSLFFLCLIGASLISRNNTTTAPNQPVPIIAKLPIPSLGGVVAPVTIRSKKLLRRDRGGLRIAAPQPSTPQPLATKINEPKKEPSIPTFPEPTIPATFISNTQTISFTFLETQSPENPTNLLQPFLQSSTFYSPNHEIITIINGKTIIHL